MKRSRGSPSRWVALALALVPVSGCLVEIGELRETGAGDAASSADGETAAGPPACDQDPWTCPAGHTCWLSVDYQVACLDAGDKIEAEDCNPTHGYPPCAEGLFCFAPLGEPDGICRRFCDPEDPARACAPSRTCIRATLPDAFGNVAGTFDICL